MAIKKKFVTADMLTISTPNDDDPLYEMIAKSHAWRPAEVEKEFFGTFADTRPAPADGDYAKHFRDEYTASFTRDESPFEKFAHPKTTAYTSGRGGGKSLTAAEFDKMRKMMTETMSESDRAAAMVMGEFGRTRPVSRAAEPELRGVDRIAAALREKRGAEAKSREPEPEPQIERGEIWGSW